MVDGIIKNANEANIYNGYVSNNMPVGSAGTVNGVSSEDEKDKKVNPKSSPSECQTCKERKYQDGSDEMVSFKSAAHISPESAASAVRAHEGEHVSNAYNKAEQGGGKVLRASVRIFTSICPECGRSYVSGGVTDTAIKYTNEKNPYVQNKKAGDADALRGAKVDEKA